MIIDESVRVRNSDPLTSAESAAQVGELAAKLRAQILDLARNTGIVGTTSNEAERLIPAHKNNSISPRFAELVESGALVRVLLGYSKKGRAVYLKRYDPITKRDVIVNFLPQFAPTPENAGSAGQPALSFPEQETESV
jgi:hypothetical protein